MENILAIDPNGWVRLQWMGQEAIINLKQVLLIEKSGNASGDIYDPSKTKGILFHLRGNKDIRFIAESTEMRDAHFKDLWNAVVSFKRQ